MPSREEAKFTAEELKRRFGFSIDIIPDAIYHSIHTEKTSTTFLSKRWEDWTGYAPQLLVDHPEIWMKTVHPEDVKRVVRAYYKASKEERDYTIEYRVIHKDTGKMHYLRDHGVFSKDLDENIVRYDGILTNITEQKEAELKLKESEKKYRQAYNQSIFYKDLFTHDINNILQNLKLSTELCSNYINKPQERSELQKVFNIIKEQIARGEKLVENVRKLTKFENLDLPVRSIDLCPILRESISYIKKSYSEKEIEIRLNATSSNYYVQANKLLLEIFENILSNSVKYNENPIIEILIDISTVDKKGSKHVKLEFKDNGIGISDSQKKVIFHKGFTRYKGGKGMGLGLTLVKTIANNYSGEIWVEDRIKGDYSKGSNFVLLIPVANTRES